MITTNKLPEYSTKLFSDIYDNAEDFVKDYKESGLYTSNNKISDDSTEVLFYLLYSSYGNNPIANYDITQFKYKMWSIIFKYGPSWEKRLDIQSKIRLLDDTEITKGSSTIYNHAYNPGTEPSTSSLSELTYINEQNTSNFKKSKLAAYGEVWDLLDTDVTSDFIKKFQVCFKLFAKPAYDNIFVTEEVEDED